eukprot:GILJ01015476.1.p1 GENE.GILJ01015476.1~~GILJ01015476.1.p1  ORF type:complete len:1228 (+),score=182.48 GILJ01015476.1:233-3685(+)
MTTPSTAWIVCSAIRRCLRNLNSISTAFEVLGGIKMKDNAETDLDVVTDIRQGCLTIMQTICTGGPLDVTDCCILCFAHTIVEATGLNDLLVDAIVDCRVPVDVFESCLTQSGTRFSRSLLNLNILLMTSPSEVCQGFGFCGCYALLSAHESLHTELVTIMVLRLSHQINNGSGINSSALCRCSRFLSEVAKIAPDLIFSYYDTVEQMIQLSIQPELLQPLAFTLARLRPLEPFDMGLLTPALSLRNAVVVCNLLMQWGIEPLSDSAVNWVSNFLLRSPMLRQLTHELPLIQGQAALSKQCECIYGNASSDHFIAVSSVARGLSLQNLEKLNLIKFSWISYIWFLRYRFGNPMDVSETLLTVISSPLLLPSSLCQIIRESTSSQTSKLNSNSSVDSLETLVMNCFLSLTLLIPTCNLVSLLITNLKQPLRQQLTLCLRQKALAVFELTQAVQALRKSAIDSIVQSSQIDEGFKSMPCFEPACVARVLNLCADSHLDSKHDSTAPWPFPTAYDILTGWCNRTGSMLVDDNTDSCQLACDTWLTSKAEEFDLLLEQGVVSSLMERLDVELTVQSENIPESTVDSALPILRLLHSIFSRILESDPESIHRETVIKFVDNQTSHSDEFEVLFRAWGDQMTQTLRARLYSSCRGDILVHLLDMLVALSIESNTVAEVAQISCDILSRRELENASTWFYADCALYKHLSATVLRPLCENFPCDISSYIFDLLPSSISRDPIQYMICCSLMLDGSALNRCLKSFTAVVAEFCTFRETNSAVSMETSRRLRDGKFLLVSRNLPSLSEHTLGSMLIALLRNTLLLYLNSQQQIGSTVDSMQTSGEPAHYEPILSSLLDSFFTSRTGLTVAVVTEFAGVLLCFVKILNCLVDSYVNCYESDLSTESSLLLELKRTALSSLVKVESILFLIQSKVTSASPESRSKRKSVIDISGMLKEQETLRLYQRLTWRTLKLARSAHSICLTVMNSTGSDRATRPITMSPIFTSPSKTSRAVALDVALKLTPNNQSSSITPVKLKPLRRVTDTQLRVNSIAESSIIAFERLLDDDSDISTDDDDELIHSPTGNGQSGHGHKFQRHKKEDHIFFMEHSDGDEVDNAGPSGRGDAVFDITAFIAKEHGSKKMITTVLPTAVLTPRVLSVL